MKIKILPLIAVSLALMGRVQSARAQFTYTSNGNGTCTITGYTGPAGTVAVPNAINGLTVVSIGDEAFEYQSAITGITIPNTVTSIGAAAFSSCAGLTNIALPNVTNIGELAFYYCSSLTNVTFPNITSIGDEAFDACGSLASLTIPTSITNISDGAFKFCGSNLTNVYFPGNAPAFGSNVFFGDSQVIVYYLNGNAGWYASFNGFTPQALVQPGFNYTASNGTITITQGYNGPGGEVTIPSTIGGLPVTGIAGSAFDSASRVTSVTIPDSVTTIQDAAIFFCDGVTNITIGSGVSSMGNSPFPDCEKLATINVDAANPYYSSLNGVLFDKNQTTLVLFPEGRGGSYAIPKSVNIILNSAFEGCLILTNVTIGSNVSFIGALHGFRECPALTSVFFEGNRPLVGMQQTTFYQTPNVTVYYLPGTAGWSSTFEGAPAVLWNPQATTLRVTGGHFGFNITGPTNGVIVVEGCTNLANPIWLPVSTNTLSGSGTATFSDSQSGNYASRFYRFRSP